MAEQQALTHDQLNIVFNLQSEVCRLMRSAEYALKATGIGFDRIGIVQDAIATIGENGVHATLEQLDLV